MGSRTSTDSVLMKTMFLVLLFFAWQYFLSNALGEIDIH
ncbi:hypothetical protein D515_02704 [Grimontia indica]|uniref:Uncharacterized protein n=1 Tax=Grimontia indica TaxID=1056512 RepID=R1IM42_9GAMM|nr:hypothetical protein D515_02704 [Grimontia indica]